MYKILSIDGGGIRGIIPAMVLSKIESLTNKPICELFDMIAGTSIGGIIALGLTKPNRQTNQPAYKADDLIRLFTQEGKVIFHNTLLHRICTLNGITNAKYKSDGMESVLKEYFAESMLSQALTDVFIPVYETELRTPFLFRSRLAKNLQNKDHDFEMLKIGMAAAAAPTYFKPYKLETAKKNEYYSLIDGGIYANNPAMCAYSEAKNIYKSAAKILLVSIGTGEFNKNIPYKKAKNWGQLEWARPLFEISMDGTNKTVDYQMNQILPSYYRLQLNLTNPQNDEMDNASDKNIDELMALGQKLIDRNIANHKLYEICANLLAP